MEENEVDEETEERIGEVMFEYGGGRVLHDAIVLHRCQPSKVHVDDCFPRPQQYPARHSRNLSATRPKLSSRPVAAFNGATWSPAFTYGDRSISRLLDRESRSGMLAAHGFSLAFRNTFFVAAG